MEKNKNDKKLLKVVKSKGEVLTLSEVAFRLKDKELFPEKVKRVKEFFKLLEPKIA